MLPFTLTQFVGLFNVFVGLMLTVSILIMGAACIMWLARLGTTPTYRDEAITLMQWAIAILFTVTVLLLLVQFVQRQTAMAVDLLGFVVLGFVAWAILGAIKEANKAPAHEE